MIENKNNNLDSWDPFLGNWLKPEHVMTIPARAEVMAIRSDIGPQGDDQVVLTLNYSAKKYDFSLNKTNVKFLRDVAKIPPKGLLHKTLVFGKVKVRNPSTKTMVDSLFIEKVE